MPEPRPPASLLRRLDLLGEGGTAVVHEAQEPHLLRTVAVKEPLGPRFAEALEREARVLSALEHPHILPLYARHDGPALVLPKLGGHTLEALLADPVLAAGARRGEAPTPWVVGRMLALCDALEHAHSRRILHRDLKPGNLMLGAFGELYVLDWGNAVSLDPDDPRPLPRAADADPKEGTPHYLAPEQANGVGLSEATDLFALGCVLHELLVGSRRNPGRSGIAVLAAAMQPEPFAYGPDVDPDLADLANALTAADPADRPASAAAVRARLLQWGDRARARALLAEAEGQWPAFATARGGDPALALQLAGQLQGTLQRALDLWPAFPEARARHAEARAAVEALEAQQAVLSDLADRYWAPRRDRLFRAALGVLGGVGTTLLTLTAVAWHRLVAPVGYPLLVPLAWLFGLGMMLAVVVGLVKPSIASRRHALQFAVLSAMIPLQWTACAWLDLPLHAAVAWNAAMSGAALSGAGVATGYLPSVLGGAVFVLGFVAAVALPTFPLEVLAVASGVSFGVFAVAHALVGGAPEGR